MGWYILGYLGIGFVFSGFVSDKIEDGGDIAVALLLWPAILLTTFGDILRKIAKGDE